MSPCEQPTVAQSGLFCFNFPWHTLSDNILVIFPHFTWDCEDTLIMAGTDMLTMTLMIPPLVVKYNRQSWKLKLEVKGHGTAPSVLGMRCAP